MKVLLNQLQKTLDTLTALRIGLKNKRDNVRKRAQFFAEILSLKRRKYRVCLDSDDFGNPKKGELMKWIRCVFLLPLVLGGCHTPNTSDGDTDSPPTSPAQLSAENLVAEVPNIATELPAVGVRMADEVFQPGIHVYSYGHKEEWLRYLARTIKEAALGDAEAPTCYQHDGKTVRLAIQTEARFADFVDGGLDAFYNSLEIMVSTFADEGFAVHLLLSVHDRPQKPWEGIDWKNKTWPDAGRYLPYQPCLQRETPDGLCSYDRIFEGFHTPVIEHLRKTGLDRHLAAIYLFNELDYSGPGRGKVKWPGCTQTDLLCRNEAVAYTTVRGLQNAAKVAGTVPLGTKFSDFRRPGSAYVPAQGADQLSYIIHDVIGPEGFIFGLDTIWGPNNPFRPKDRARLEPLMGSLSPNQLVMAEFSVACSGPPGKIVDGRRTLPADMTGLMNAWPEARSTNLFAFNATGTPDGCYALFDQVKTEKLFPGTVETLQGLWAQTTTWLGTENPQACN